MKQWFNDDTKEQFKMDFKKCSEVYGYKSIAEVEEEELEAKLAERDREMARKMLENGIPIDKVSIITGIPEEEILSWKNKT